LLAIALPTVEGADAQFFAQLQKKEAAMLLQIFHKLNA